MNQQEIFDTVATHLFEQGIMATDGVSCVYRSRNGNKCAIGCLIPDNVYTRKMEGKNIQDLRIGFYDVLPKHITLESNIYLLSNLQATHDYAGNWLNSNRLKEQLEYVAKAYNLKHDVLANLSFNKQ